MHRVDATIHIPSRTKFFSVIGSSGNKEALARIGLCLSSLSAEGALAAFWLPFLPFRCVSPSVELMGPECLNAQKLCEDGVNVALLACINCRKR